MLVILADFRVDMLGELSLWVTVKLLIVLKSTCFLAATGQLYKRVCRLVCLSVDRSVCRYDLAFLASNFDISAVYGRIGLCFGYDAPLGLYYHTYRAHAPITSFRGPSGPLN